MRCSSIQNICRRVKTKTWFRRLNDQHIEQRLRLGNGDDTFLEKCRGLMAVQAKADEVGSRHYDSNLIGIRILGQFMGWKAYLVERNLR